MEAAANEALESEKQSLKQRTEQEELLAATASIMLPEEQQQQTTTIYNQDTLITSHYFTQTDQDSQQIIYDTVDSSDDLCRVATEILSGVRRNVEVQIIDTNNCFSTEDYLNPITKDEIMHESGLRSQPHHQQQQPQYHMGQDFFVTDVGMDPVELGINLTTNGEEVFFSDDFSHYFSHNIVA